MRHQFLLLSCLPLIPLGPVRADDAPSFELLDGDRVVFIGNTFIERDQVYGYLETMLTARWPDRNITFRNLGWSGDTVWGEARARFGSPADGFKHLKEHIEQIKPTVIFVGYGSNESFEGEAGLSKFTTGLNTLLDMLVAAAPAPRVIMLSPTWQENLGRPLPDPTRHNEDIKRYADVIRAVASERGHRFGDLLGSAEDRSVESPGGGLTDNGIHLTEYGYWRIATAIMRDFRAEAKSWRITVGKDGKLARADGVEVTSFEKLPRGFRFEATAEHLPRPQRPLHPGEKWLRVHQFGEFDGRLGELHSVERGDYEIRIDNEDAGSFMTDAAGPLWIEYEADRVAQLRQTIIEKNRLYFHRWRPQNETYLFGFRKHEQGQNAAEVPKFDPLVEELEAKIAKLRVPVKHTYELIRSDENRDD